VSEAEQSVERRVAIVLSEKGFHWTEALGAYRVFLDAGWACRFFTVGGPPQVDPRSVVTRPLMSLVGYGCSKADAPDTEIGKRMQAGIDAAEKIAALDADEFDAIFLAGGHGAPFDVNPNTEVHEAVGRLHKKGRVLSGVCHATSGLAVAPDDDGKPIGAGKRFAGFPDLLDGFMVPVGMVEKAYLPIPLSNQDELARAGARYEKLMSIADPTYTVVDPPFVTGAGPKAVAKTAREVVKLVESSAG
jgi:putative intracellular protease/amidase